MKPNIHPNWYPNAKVVCACGNTFTIGSTKPEIHVEVCSVCHPFWTGKQKYVDTEGRVDRFARHTQIAAKFKEEKATKTPKEREKKQERPKSLHELRQISK